MEYKLNTIADNPGARKKRMTICRGIGSGKGKTGGRGGKGQTARSGSSINGFEGGQTPIYRRLPKRGFHNIHAIPKYELTFDKVSQLLSNGFVNEGDTINAEVLKKFKFMPNYLSEIRLIATGTLDKKINFAITKASKKAAEMVEKAGGSIVFE